MDRKGPQGLRYQAHVAFRTAYELLANLERVRNRRKALILISGGYDFDPFPAGRTGTDQVFGGRYGSPWVNPESGDRFLALEKVNNQFADADLASELAAVTGMANRVNASIYAIDPRGVAGTTSVAEQIDMTEMRTHIGKTQGSLQVLSEATGGFAVINDNTYDEALTRIDAETSDYYILGYSSTNGDPTRRNRQVEVKGGTARSPGGVARLVPHQGSTRTAAQAMIGEARRGARTIRRLPALVLLIAAGAQIAAQPRSPAAIVFATSGTPAAHAEFLTGVAALHNFEYEDANAAFIKAQQIDPGFAMAYWGEAMTYHQTLWAQRRRRRRAAHPVASRAGRHRAGGEGRH
jgi:hypothetical protein